MPRGWLFARRLGATLARDAVELLLAANNYAASLLDLRRFEEARVLLRGMLPIARRVLGMDHGLTLSMRNIYAMALWRDPSATLDDLREAVTMLEEAERTARRVFGGAHPSTTGLEKLVQAARAILAARETPPSQSSSESV